MLMGRQLRNPKTEYNLLSCQPVNQVHEIHDRFVEKMNELTFEQYEFVNYPDPPFEGTKTIIPISNNKELHIEGRSMKHCIVSYHKRILQNDYFVLKVLEPERATVGLHKKNGRIAIDQIRLKCNRMPSEQTKEVVYWWLQNT